MAPPIYFFPGPAPNLIEPERPYEMLKECGLEYIIDDGEDSMLAANGVPGGGPSGSPGMIIISGPVAAYGGSIVKPYGYYDDRQDWTKLKSDPEVWIGIERAHPPNAIDLMRRKLVAGHEVELNGGEKWLIPCARLMPKGTRLPCVMKINDKGEIDYKVKREYRELSDWAEKIYRSWIGQMFESQAPGQAKIKIEIGDKEFMEIGAMALAINYRLSLLEVSRFEIFDSDCLRQIVDALIDVPTLMEAMEREKEKKKED